MFSLNLLARRIYGGSAMASGSLSSEQSGRSGSSSAEQRETPETVPEDYFDAVEDWHDLSPPPRADEGGDAWEHVYDDNGRRYHHYKQGRYPYPNDEMEQNRERIKHVLMLELTDGKLHLAPLSPDVEKIIDIGTGTGIWAIEMGDLYPESQILGIDLSPIQPRDVPPNVRFMIDDCEDDWANGSGWDYAHFRYMTPTLIDAEKVIRETFTHLKPGGWIEFQELFGLPCCDDGTMSDDDELFRFCNLVKDALEDRDMDFNKCRALRGPLTRAGFTNIELVKAKIPIGEWGADEKQKKIGYLLLLSILDITTAITGKMLEDMGLSRLEREVWSATVKKSATDLSVHRYLTFYIWTAQKPYS